MLKIVREDVLELHSGAAYVDNWGAQLGHDEHPLEEYTDRFHYCEFQVESRIKESDRECDCKANIDQVY